MNKPILLTTMAVLVLASSGCGVMDKLKARDQLNKGVEAYKNAKYGEAVDHFKQAIELDPTNPNARLYLATAYMNQYIPGADSPDNNKNSQAARDEFMKVLQDNPNDKMAVQSLASLSYSEAGGISDVDAKLKKLDEARKWNERLIQIDPNSKEGYYTLAVIDWAKWYPNYTSARVKLGMKPEDPGPIKDKKARQELKDTYDAMIQDGIKNLEMALKIDPQYDDAMSYLNLLIRERADLDDNTDDYKKDIATAEMWMNKAMDTRKIKAAKAAPTGGLTTGEQK